MAAKAVVDAVTARLTANWTACPILKENQTGSAPADGSAYLVLQFPVANLDRPALSDRLYREEGGFRIVINVPTGFGMDLLFTWGDQLAAIFRDQTFSGVRCQVPTSPFTDQDSDAGNYFTATVVCPYWFTFRDS